MNRFNVKYLTTKFRGYPIGTIAFYGPNDKTTTKIVAAVIEKEDSEPTKMKKWVGANIINDISIQKTIQIFFQENKVKTVIKTESPIGCIHEEGLDYPEGQECPFCPFWKERKRK